MKHVKRQRQTAFMQWSRDGHGLAKRTTCDRRTVPTMTSFRHWVRLLGGPGAVENAANECQERRRAEAALDQRLRMLSPRRAESEAA